MVYYKPVAKYIALQEPAEGFCERLTEITASPPSMQKTAAGEMRFAHEYFGMVKGTAAWNRRRPD